MELNKKLKIPGVRELIQITINRKEWHLRTPLQKFSYLYGIGKACTSPTGFTVFQDDQKIVWYSYVIGSFFIIYQLFAAYTVFHYVNKGELLQCLPCTCLLGLAISTAPLVFNVLSKTRYLVHSLVDYGGKYIYPDNHENTEYNRICSENIDATIRKFFTKITIIFLSFCATMIGPAHAYIYHGVKSTITELKFPFIEEKSNDEFIGNVAVQIGIGGIGLLAYTGIEIAVGLLDDVASISPKLVKNELKKFDALVKSKRLNELQIQYIFRNIVKQTLNSDDFTVRVRDHLYYRTLVTPPTFTYAIAMSFFCQYTLDLATGYGMAVISFVQLFYMCELGDNIGNDGFAELLYDSHWYRLPKRCQLIMIHLINRKQNGVKITVGPFGEINRELTTITTKRIYSFIMYMLNLTNK